MRHLILTLTLVATLAPPASAAGELDLTGYFDEFDAELLDNPAPTLEFDFWEVWVKDGAACQKVGHVFDDSPGPFHRVKIRVDVPPKYHVRSVPTVMFDLEKAPGSITYEPLGIKKNGQSNGCLLIFEGYVIRDGGEA